MTADSGLVVLEAQTGAKTQLAGPPAFGVADPVWSPNGQTVAFSASEIVNGIGGKHGLFTIPASGGAPRAVVPMGDAHIQNIHWFPDGQRLVYVAAFQGGGWRVHTVHADGTSDLSLPWPSNPDTADTESDPSISGDGSLVAFAYASCTTRCYSGVATETPDGNSPSVVVETIERGFRPTPVWTPDGHVAYTRGTELHVAAADRSSDEIAADAGLALSGPVAFGPDGSVAVQYIEGSPARIFDLPWHLQLLAPDGSTKAQVADDVFYPSTKVQWIGQGSGLLFASNSHVAFIRADGSGITHILDGGVDFDWHQ